MPRSRDRIFVPGGSDVSFIDYPGRIAAMLFTANCNFRCGYCHNPSLVSYTGGSFRRLKDILADLKKRHGLIDGVVITGGEPTIHDELPDIIAEIAALELPVKLNTNGSHPDVVRRSMDHLSYVSVDIKTAPPHYTRVTSIPDAGERVHETISFLRTSKLPWDIHITAAPGVFGPEDIDAILPLCIDANVLLQKFDPSHVMDSAFASLLPYSAKTMEAMRERIRAVAHCEIL